MAAGCVLCRQRHDEPMLTCAPCAKRLGDDLAAAGQMLGVLRDLLEPGRAARAGGRRVEEAPAPLRVDVLSLLDPRNEAAPGRVLNGLAFRVCRASSATCVPDDPVGVLLERLPWLLGDVLVVTVRSVLDVVLRDLRRVCGEPAAVRVAVCTRHPGDDVVTTPCGGPIYAVPGADVAMCRRCGDEWPRAKWGLLGRLQQGRAS